jgi:hypothetical protein
LELEAYLKSDVLFWQLTPVVPISPPAPMLTVGGFLLRVHRLDGRRGLLNPVREQRLDAALKSFQDVTQEWSVHTEKRIRRELRSRINSWQWFVDDCQANKRSCITYYATEAELRTLIEHIFEFGHSFRNMDDLQARLVKLDALFRLWFKPGSFIWRGDLEQIYPQERFWWLYGLPDFPAK